MDTSASGLWISDAHQSVLATRASTASPAIGYSAFGWRVRAAPLPVLGFNGQLPEEATACYHLGHGRRVYNCALMRFHQADALSPFGAGGLNAYAYCLGDPINYRDPSGAAVQVPDWVRETWVPIITIIANIGVLGAVVGNALIAPKALTRLGKMGVVGSAIGAPIAIGGAIATLVKPSSEATLAGYVGSGLNMVGVISRFGAMAQKARKIPNLKAVMRRNVQSFFGVPAKKVNAVSAVPPATGPASAPAIGRSVLTPSTYSGPTDVRANTQHLPPLPR